MNIIECPKKLHKYEVTPKYRGKCPECAKAWTTAKRHRTDVATRKGEKLMAYWPGTTAIEALAKRNQMFKDQRGCCAVCNRHESTLVRSLMVDHDHETGQIRSLLCQFCNTAEGYLKTPEMAEALAAYMRRHKQ
jgi:Recombination endonuclease VII